MKVGKNVKKAGALLGIMTILLVGTFGAFSSGLLDRPKEDPDPIQPKPHFPINHLSIDASFLLKTEEKNDTVLVSCDLFMTNIWEKESEDIKATAYVIEKNTNLAIFKSTVEFGKLDANSTTELNIPLEFSDSSYKVEILLFEKNKIVLKAQSTITSRQRYSYGVGGSIVYSKGFAPEDGVCLGDNTDQWDIENTQISVHRVN